MPGTILVVDPDPIALGEAARLLSQSGSDIALANTFDDAKRVLDTRHPSVLITAVRLGAFNGLHLVARTRDRRDAIAAIVVGEESDRGLQADAAELGAFFIVRSLVGGALLTLVGRALDGQLA